MNTTIIANWTVKNEHLEKVITLISELQKESQKEIGNVSYQIFQSSKEPQNLTLFEEYVSQDALMEHLKSEHYQRIAVNQIQPLLSERAFDLYNKL